MVRHSGTTVVAAGPKTTFWSSMPTSGRATGALPWASAEGAARAPSATRERSNARIVAGTGWRPAIWAHTSETAFLMSGPRGTQQAEARRQRPQQGGERGDDREGAARGEHAALLD